MIWKESGGPLSIQPTRTGFNFRLIDMGLVGQGGVQKRFLETGLQVEFDAAMSMVQGD